MAAPASICSGPRCWLGDEEASGSSSGGLRPHHQKCGRAHISLPNSTWRHKGLSLPSLSPGATLPVPQTFVKSYNPLLRSNRAKNGRFWDQLTIELGKTTLGVGVSQNPFHIQSPETSLAPQLVAYLGHGNRLRRGSTADDQSQDLQIDALRKADCDPQRGSRKYKRSSDSCIIWPNRSNPCVVKHHLPNPASHIHFFGLPTGHGD